MIFLFYLFPLLASGLGLQTVTTSYGRVRGITDYSDKINEKYIFKGVPFAQPPVGNLRFRPPLQPKPWNHVLDASLYQAACLSNSSVTSTPQSYISEDCLYINIFTSEECLKKKCPVIVYFHGGSFNLDSATMFPEPFILDRYVEQGIVFAIPAFRLGVFGQFYLGDSDVVPSNLLIHDNIAALKFVNAEIENFGGNASDVTIMGHSSGGSLVDALGFSKIVDSKSELFQKLIVLSSHGQFGFTNILVNNSFEIAKRLGCESENKQEIVECMRQKDSQEILQTQKEMEENDNLVFKYILRNLPLMEPNEKISDFKNGAPARKMLCGVTEHEFEKFGYEDDYYVSGQFLDFENPIDVVLEYRKDYTNQTAALLNSDSSSVFVSAATYSEALVNNGGEVFLFETRQKPYSMHVSDMQYFIGIHREKEHTPDMDILDSFYSRMLVNFTKFGQPSPYWEKYDPARMNFLALEVDTKNGIGPKMEDGFHEELVDVWLIEMKELDQNITSAKQSRGTGGEDQTTRIIWKTTTKTVEQTTHISTEAEETSIRTTAGPVIGSDLTSTSESEPSSQTTWASDSLKEDVPIYNQWWFYAIILLAFLVLVFVFCVLKKSARGESQPLLG